MDQFAEKIFDVEDVQRSLEEQGPYQNVLLQELDRSNILLAEIKRSLQELQLGFNGELTMSEPMEALMNSLFLDSVPDPWTKRAWPSMRGLSAWLMNFTMRLNQLEEWCGNPSDALKCTWISGIGNPQSFLTAIKQVTAQRNQWELDKLDIQTDVSKRMLVDEIEGASRDGAYIIGLSLQGARWDVQGQTIEKSRPKEMFTTMPIINCRGVDATKVPTQGVYLCPTYKTEQRGPTFVMVAQLRTKAPPARWVMAGVAMLMDVV